MNPHLPATTPLPPTLAEEANDLSREHNALWPSMMMMACAGEAKHALQLYNFFCSALCLGYLFIYLFE